MLLSLLNLKNVVTVTRLTEISDGLGGLSTTSAVTTLSRCNLWQVGSGDSRISDKIVKSSTHILAIESGAYSFTVDDRTVGYKGGVYQLTGNYDDVGERGELVLAGLKWQQ